MSIDFSKLFHLSSKDSLKGHSPILPNSKDWPESWKTIEYKEYPRMKKIKLNGETPSADFFKLIPERESIREFSGEPVRSDILSNLLKYSCGIVEKNGTKRAQPSGGARYPIETYMLNFKRGELPDGVFHYNIADHALEHTWNKKFSENDFENLFTYPWVKNSSFAIILTAIFDRNQRKYGERGYRHILLEAGHIGQNLYLSAGALGLSVCALSGVRDEKIEEVLDIDGVTESVVYCLVFG